MVARKPGTDDRVVVADALCGRVLGEGWQIVARIRGTELAGSTYRAPFSLVRCPVRAGSLPGRS